MISPLTSCTSIRIDSPAKYRESQVRVVFFGPDNLLLEVFFFRDFSKGPVGPWLSSGPLKKGGIGSFGVAKPLEYFHFTHPDKLIISPL